MLDQLEPSEEVAIDEKVEIPAISIRDLRIDYGSHLAVDNMSVEIPAGVIYGLVGPNGAGKTSTFKALASLLKATNGTLLIHGHNVATNQQQVQSIIGYMPDMAPVPSDLKVFEFLDMFAGAHGLRGKAKAERIKECLDLVSLMDQYHSMCVSLSRGMMQRLVLAKTLLHHPKLLILDEPASGMDLRSRVQLRNILRDVCKKGATVLISSHILPELSDMCDQIGILHRGKLLDSGSVDGVFHRMTGLLPEIRVRLSEAADMHWQEWLNNQKFVSSPTASDPLHLHFHFDGSDTDLSSLISKMIAKGYLVCRVEEQQRSLEDILLDLEYDGH